VACSLLDRQIATLERNFVEEGGFTERLYRVRSQPADPLTAATLAFSLQNSAFEWRLSRRRGPFSIVAPRHPAQN
jgi:hypothetical protein